MSETECPIAVWVTSPFLPEFSIKVGASWVLHVFSSSQHLVAWTWMVLLWLHWLLYYCRQPQSLYHTVLRLKMFGKVHTPGSIRNTLNFLAALSTDFHPAFIKRSNLDQIRTCIFPVKLRRLEGRERGTKGAETARVGEFWELWLEVWEIWLKEQGVEYIVDWIAITLITVVIQRNPWPHEKYSKTFGSLFFVFVYNICLISYRIRQKIWVEE